MLTSRADVPSPDPGRHATLLVAGLAARVPAVLDGRTSKLTLGAGTLHVTPGDAVLRLEAVAEDAASLRAVEDETVRHVASTVGRGVLAVEWWSDDGRVRRDTSARRYRPGPVSRLVDKVPPALFRSGRGHLLGTSMLELTTSGRRTGRPRKAVLQTLRYDPATRTLLVMAAYGRGSDWYLNLHHGVPLRIRIGRESFVPAFRELDVEEAAAELAAYEREHPVLAFWLRFGLSRNAGWRYHGTPAERRRLVAQLPVLEFRPVEP